MWIFIAIALPFLFVVGLVYNAIKEQKKLEKGELKAVLENRRREEEEYLKRTGKKFERPDPYEDKDQ
ncbi:MAG: hypothetical protein J5934_03440 [Succinivibrio sp.]|nr:hypothetical protein [Succinivibrio sp.]